MESPKVSYCIVCEDIRTEMFGKLSILGMYGLLPDVDIVVQEFGKPVERFMLLLGFNRGSGSYNFELNIINPDNKIIRQTAMPNFTPLPDKITMAGINHSGLIFDKAGVYIIQVVEKKLELYNATFKVTSNPTLFHQLQSVS